MKALVSIKRVIDYSVKIRVTADQSGVETTNVKMGINPFDAIAVEEAVRLKEANALAEIIVISIGDNCQDILRYALALGADRAIHIATTQLMQPLTVAKILHKIIVQEQPELVLLGKQAIDDDCNQTGQMLAGLLNWPQATFASKILLNNKEAIVTREVDGGLETLCIQLPAVITSDLRLNEPRFASLPNIMRAKQKSLTTLTPQELQIDVSSSLEVLAVSEPPKRQAGIIVNSVDELLEKLKQAQVIA